MTTSPANSPVNTASSHSTSPVSAASSGSFWSDMKILWHMIVRQGRGQTHEERLEDFYKGQASGYDSFRKRLLHGKKDLFDQLPAPPGGVWVDLGAGTGENAENWGERLNEFSNVYLVDLSSSLLKVAQARIEQRGWQNVKAIHHDATTFLPPEGMADVVTFSYSLTMIPDWHKAVDQAIRMLKPGGGAGNCRFLCQPQISPEGNVRHVWSTRHFWQIWFATDNVFLSGDHLPYLQSHLETVVLSERRGKVPYMPFVRAPHYVYVGRKPVV